MQKHNYTRKQRRHNRFVLEHDGKYLAFAPDGVNFGFTNFLNANAFNWDKAKILQAAIQSHHLNIQMIARVNGKLSAV